MFIPGVKCPLLQGTLSILLCPHLVVSPNVFPKNSGCFSILSDACWLTNTLKAWLTDRLPDWPTDWVTDWLSSWLIHWPTFCMTLTDQKIDWLIFWMYLYYCLSNWQSAWLIEWLTYWLTAKSHGLNCNAVSQTCVLIGFFQKVSLVLSRARFWACPFFASQLVLPCPNWKNGVSQIIFVSLLHCHFLPFLVFTPEGHKEAWEWWNVFHNSKNFLNYPINVHRRCKMPPSPRDT